MTKSTCVFLVAFVLVGNRAESLVAQGTLDVIARNGDPSPDGNSLLSTFLYRGNSQNPDYIHTFFAPVVNDRGEVGFWAAMGDTLGAYASDPAMLVGTRDHLRIIARQGQLLPDGTSVLGVPQPPALDADGGTWFTTAVSPSFFPELADYSLIYASEAGFQIALTTPLPSPDGNGSLQTLWNAAANRSGSVALNSTLMGTAGGFNDNRGIYEFDGAELRQIVRAGQTTPDGLATFSPFLGDPNINESNQVAFYASISGGYGLYASQGGVIRQIARLGETLNGASGEVTHLGGASQHFQPTLNASGEIAFGAHTTNDGSAVYLASGNEITKLIGSGEPATDGNGVAGTVGLFGFNDVGQAVVSVEFSGTSGANHPNGGKVDSRSVYRVSGDEITQLARAATRTPDGTAYFAGFPDMAINPNGLVAYQAGLTHSPGAFSLDKGIYLTDGIETLEVARYGQPLGDGTIRTLTIGMAASHGEAHGETLDSSHRPLNTHGQVAFHAQTGGNTESIALFTPTLRWRSLAGGAWDEGANWTLGIEPAHVHPVVIAPESAAAISGPAADVTVRSLTVGDSEHIAQATLNLQPGATLTATDGISLENNSKLSFDLNASSSPDLAPLVTNGPAVLGGAIAVAIDEAFDPHVNDFYLLLRAWGGIFNDFESVLLPTRHDGKAFRLLYGETIVGLEVILAGDYNDDGKVDAADYVVWRKHVGSMNALPNDPNGGAAGQAQFDSWVANFGATAGGGSASHAAVPEPAAVLLLTWAAAALARTRRRNVRKSPSSRECLTIVG